jgi:outer membrane lipase/esterase
MKAQKGFRLRFSCNVLPGKSRTPTTYAQKEGKSPEKKRKHLAWRFLPMTLLVCVGIVAMTATDQAAGQTPEQEMSSTVNVVCPQLAANSASLNPAETDVLKRCGELVGPYPTLNSSQINGLSNMTSTQTDSMGSSTVNISYAQFATVTGRLAYLRGLGSGGLALNINNDNAEPILFAGPVTAAAGGNTASTQELEMLGGRLGLFLNGTYATGNQDATNLEPGFDFDSWGVIGGADYRFTDTLFLGLALGYSWTDSDVDNNAGNVDADGYGISAYGTYYIGNFYFNAIGTYANKDYNITRNLNYTVAAKPAGSGLTTVNQKFEADPDSDEYSFSVAGGYDFNVKKFTLSPYLRLDYLNIKIDAYKEKLTTPNSAPGYGLALQVEEQTIKSFTSNLGGQIYRDFGAGKSVLTPYLRAEWVHEFDNDARNITAGFINVPLGTAGNTIIIPTDDPDRNFFNFGLGLSATLPRGIMAFADWQTILGLSNVTLNQITAGLRFEL